MYHCRNEESGGESEAEEAIREPSKEEIDASYKPENVINVETVREKKRKTHKKITEKTKETSTAKDTEAVKEYLNKWKTDRSSWKFEKKKQIFIQMNCFEPSKIHDDDWAVCLEYLDGSKGKSRETLVASAEKIISELDSHDKQDEVAKVKYSRSRDLLQMLN